MDIREIIRIAGDGFPGGLERFFDAENGKAIEAGDTLATAIVREIIETYDAGLSDSEQLFAAAAATFRAIGRERNRTD